MEIVSFIFFRKNTAVSSPGGLGIGQGIANAEVSEYRFVVRAKKLFFQLAELFHAAGMCRPCSNGVSSQASIMRRISSSPRRSAAKQRIFALL